MNKRANVYAQNGIIFLTKSLANRSPMDFSPLPVPSKKVNPESQQLIESFNHYQARMKALVERELSFNRYIDQEIRSSLMVMQGAVALLEESRLSEFQERQKQRIDQTTGEMAEMLETLVDLSHSLHEPFIPYEVDTKDLSQLISSQSHIVKFKPVTWNLDIISTPQLSMPAKSFRSLIRLLSKSVFSQTMKGEIVFSLSEEKLYISIGRLDQHDIELEEAKEYPLILEICEAYQLSLNTRGVATDRSAIELTFKTSASCEEKLAINIVPFQHGSEQERN